MNKKSFLSLATSTLVLSSVLFASSAGATATASPQPSSSPTSSPVPSSTPTVSSTPTPTISTTPQPGTPVVSGLTINLLQGDYTASSVAPGSPLTVQVALSEQGILSPLPLEPITLTYHPTDGSPNIVQEISISNNFSGCSVPEYQCYYYEETVNEKVSGTMTVSYDGTAAQYAAASVPIDVWVPQKRMLVDQKDEKLGFQVHAVYVVPSDGIDRSRDSSGQISTWLKQGSAWLNREAGDSWQIDTSAGTPDVTFFHSKYSSNILRNSDNGLAPLLAKEMGKKLLPNGTNRKTYIFFIEVPTFVTQTTDAIYKGRILCGLSQVATNPVRMAIVATGAPGIQECSGHADTLDWPAAVATHETIHTFGIHHVTTTHDIMLKVPDNTQTLLLDPTHKQYYGGALAGANIKALRIWSKNPTDQSASWPCIYDQTTLTYWCGVETTNKVNAYPAQCWKLLDPTMTLQVLKNKVWTTVSKATSQKNNDCPKGYPAEYGATFSSNQVGTYSYRYKTSSWTGKTFTIVFQL